MGHARISGKSRVAKPHQKHKRRDSAHQQPHISQKSIESLPQSQTQVLLYEARTPYEIAHSRDLPITSPGELLVKVQAIGLNPIDWKSA
jgi:hypothetical protein